MAELVAHPPETLAEPEQMAVAQTGASLFPELVWAHYVWERQAHGRRGEVDPDVEARYREALRQFEEAEGKILTAYWSTYRASAVALTEKEERGFLRRLLGEDDAILRFHRVTDWATEDAPRVADVLYKCDTLAVRISEVLRGPAERVAMQLVASVANYLLGFVDRTKGRPDPRAAETVADEQEHALARIEAYYDRAGTKAGRLVYFWGMVAGIAVLIALAAVLAAFFWTIGLWDKGHTPALQIFFSAYAAGALGALVSVLQRMSSREQAFRLDYEVGRGALVRLGSFRPFIGAVSGVAMYFLLAGGLLQTTAPDGDRAFFYYGTLAFLAGFSERWTNVIFGGAERMLTKAARPG